ncbi:hypothetical protein ACH4Y0_02915 [Streptomyces sp. NPDC020707]|uniref:hypothetical protein n=1 Tax=Streptomyces sp. NPDC020707 TaxID=3365084 RepID=UPI0037978ED9
MTEDQPQLPEQPAQGHATASQAVPQRPQVPSVVTAEQWAAGFRQTHLREPTMPEYQAAVQAGLIAPERRPRDPSMQQRTNEAKEFLSNRVAPAGQRAARSMQQSTSRPGLAKLRGLATFILPVTAFLAIISLFMPIASAMGFSVNYVSDEAGGEGGFLLFTMLVAITAGVVGIVAGLTGMIDGFGTMGSVSGTRYASVGAGVVLLALLSVVILAAAVLILLSPRQASAVSPMPSMPPIQPPQS